MIPPLRVCNDPGECSYREMCEPIRERLLADGIFIECLENEVVPGDPPDRRPLNWLCADERLDIDLCDPFELPECMTSALPDPPRAGSFPLGDCRPDVPRCDPRCGVSFDLGGLAGGRLPGGDPLGGGELGLRCCGGGGFGAFAQDPLLAWLEGGRILEAEGVLVRHLGQDDIEAIDPRTRLRFGDLLIMPAGSRFRVRTRAGAVAFSDEGGIPSVHEWSARPIDERMLVAVEQGDAKTVAVLLEQGASPHAIAPSGASALTRAVERRDPEMVKVLARAGADVNRPDARGNRPAQLVRARDPRREGGGGPAEGPERKGGRASARDRAMAQLLRQLGAVDLGERVVRKSERPLLVLVTGPSAATAPHPGGRPYLSAPRARRLAAKKLASFEPPPMKDRLARRLAGEPPRTQGGGDPANLPAPDASPW